MHCFSILSSSKVSFSQQGQWRLFTVNTVIDGFFMICFDNLITHERDLSFVLMSSLDIHTPAFNFLHLEGGTVPSSGWRLARYRPRRHLATDYALRWRGWLSEKPKVARRRHWTSDWPRRNDEPKKGDSSSCILFLRPTA